MADKNKQLMLARGSKTGTYDAEAPDTWKFDLRHGVGEVKALAWVKSKTIALGHWSPFCVDEHGKSLYIEHLALECGWQEQTARNYLTKLAAEGRIILKNKQIWYCADIPLAYKDLPQENPPNGRTNGVQSNSVQSWNSRYVVEFIEKLPAKKKAAAEAKRDAFTNWKKTFMADGQAALRDITDRIEDTTLLEIGIPKKRLAKRREEAESKWVQLKLLAEPNFVQSYSPDLPADSVQTADSSLYEAQNGSYKQKNGDASFMYSSTATTSTTTAPPPPVDEVVVVVSKIRDYGGTISKPAARKLLNQCHIASPNCTVEEVAAGIDQIGSTLGTGIRNRTAVFVTGLPSLIATNKAIPPRKRESAAEPVCWVCKEPLTGAAMNGAHIECYEQAKQKKAESHAA